MAAGTTKTTQQDKPAKQEPAAEPKEKKAARSSLTLQQKLVEIRKAIPMIQQQAHSDSVKYKFAKIFDIYKLMAPALNEWGVNFDIVEETATRHAENGDEQYFTTYNQHTRNGDRVVWVYEAELTIRWTDADNPNDHFDVTMHAIGTNDGGPDKAKGSAWTYCLKYYFFEKFNIDQGECDPDEADHSTEPTAPPASSTAHPTEQGGGNQPPAQQNAAQRLTGAQINRLYRKAEDAGMTKEQTDARIMQCYKVKAENLTRQQYDSICEQLDASISGKK